MSFNKAEGSSCLNNVFDLIYLDVVCLLAIKMALHFDYYYFKPYKNARTPINIFVQRGHGRTSWESDNLGICRS